jgi:hypothetical protein
MSVSTIFGNFWSIVFLWIGREQPVSLAGSSLAEDYSTANQSGKNS